MMTSFGSVFKELFKDKIKTMSVCLAISAIAILATVLCIQFPNVFGSWNLSIQGILIAVSSITLIGFPFGIIFLQEMVWNKNQYQLIPISQGKIVWANFLSSVATLIGSYLIQAAIFVGAGFALRGSKIFDVIDWNQVVKDLDLDGIRIGIEMLIEGAVGLLVFTIMAFAMVSVLNLLFILIQKRFTKFQGGIKYFILGITFFGFGGLIDNIGSFFSQRESFVVSTIGFMLIVSIILTMISSWLFTKHVETKK